MNFSIDIREAITDLILKNMGGTAANPNVGRWNDTYTINKEKSNWNGPKRGRFGVVYKATRKKEESEKAVAVKEIALNLQSDYRALGLSRFSPSVRNDSTATFNFLMACQESVLQSSEDFQHYNIVKCYDSWIEQPPSEDTEEDRERLDPEALIDFVNGDELTERIRSNLELAKGKCVPPIKVDKGKCVTLIKVDKGKCMPPIEEAKGKCVPLADVAKGKAVPLVVVAKGKCMPLVEVAKGKCVPPVEKPKVSVSH